jgi:hypothetical protein
LVPPRLDLRAPGTWLHWLDEAFAANPNRLWHSRAVWHRIATARRHELRWLGDEQADTLELAALLHDVGRALDPSDSEPHGFVGGAFLDAVGLRDVAPLVAHHSGSRSEARDRGCSHLDMWTSDDDLRSLLTYVDRTTGPSGESVTLAERRAEIAARFGADAQPVRWFDESLVDTQRGAQLFSSVSRDLIA